MELYHWTTAKGYAGISHDRLIKATWPKHASDAIPDRVVWLTTRSDDDQGWNVGEKATCAYIVAEVPDDEVVPWAQYRRELPSGAVGGLETSARAWGNGDPDTWYVVRRDIPKSEWIRLGRMAGWTNDAPG